MKIRLNKYISDCGITSRRKAEEYILQGRVEVNQKVIVDLSFKIDSENDLVTFDGEKLKKEDKVYYVLNKPKGVVTTTNDEKNRRTVIDLVKSNKKVFPVGRLDYNTTGILIITNDGEFSNLLTHPRNKVPRVYDVTLNKYLPDADRIKLLKGITLEGRRGRFISVQINSESKNNQVRVTTDEGRNHFVKNMFSVLNYRVLSLERISFGTLNVKNLIAGSYRELTKKEIENIIAKYS